MRRVQVERVRCRADCRIEQRMCRLAFALVNRHQEERKYVVRFVVQERNGQSRFLVIIVSAQKMDLQIRDNDLRGKYISIYTVGSKRWSHLKKMVTPAK
jgi:hypothetical protein